MREQSAVTGERVEDPAKLSNGDILQAVIAPLARLWRRSTATVVDPKPGSAERHYRDGVLRMRSGDTDGAIAEFDKALREEWKLPPKRSAENRKFLPVLS